MELSINVTTNDSCKIIVEDNSKYRSGLSTTVSKGNFKYTETISIDVLQLNRTSETEYQDPVYTKHDGKTRTVEMPVSFDGWFSIVHIILPTKKWFEESSAVGLYSTVYYSDGQNIYKYVDGTTSQVTIEEVTEVNTAGTTISITSKDYFSICYIRRCYIDLCKQIFNDRAFSSCWSDNDVDSELIYKRDLVWMAINVIKYLVKCNQLAEAERIVEILNDCNGICPANSTSTTNGCGCFK